MKLVLVEWEDSCVESNWHSQDIKYEGIALCTSSGIKIAETESFIVVASSINSFSRVSETISIPKSCIRRIRYLRVR